MTWPPIGRLSSVTLTASETRHRLDRIKDAERPTLYRWSRRESRALLGHVDRRFDLTAVWMFRARLTAVGPG
jgi:hypothetical protein